MILNKLRVGTVTIEVSAPVPEKFLNLLWNKGVKITKVTRVDITTIRLDINYDEYKEVEEAAKRCKGKIKVIGRQGLVFILMRIKKQFTLALGILVFLFGIYLLSTYVWSIDIKTGANVAPYQIRKQLTSLGVKPGIKKSDLDVYTLEKKLEDINSDILWLRARVEGSTLKVIIEEKVNPPVTADKETSGECVAKDSGEIKRIYITSGTAKVSVGDMVKAGDLLIAGIQGKEGLEYEVQAKGTVIANVFYEKEMEVQVSGKRLEKTGERDNDIYLSFFGKKIYLKKAINNFDYYDKIEDNKSFINTVTYFERSEKEVSVDKDEAINKAKEQLEASLSKTLSNEAKITDKKVSIEEVEEGKIRVKVNFVVEQDIASTVSQ
ncbi:sporulation protein YqfD [Clostridium sp. LP20]|uniref:sporulation protein YqfD n=1 Tax=Clostridium sp. LP20 TaxID=3418665 RepID=UPI003EE4C9FB